MQLQDLSIRQEGRALLKNISWEVKAGETWALTGPSGSGKTVLGKLIAGQYTAPSEQLHFFLPDFYKRIFVSQQHDFRYLSSARSYYQQRFDSNYGTDFPLVREALERKHPVDDPAFQRKLADVSVLLKITPLLEKRLIELSNGEGKRVQLAQALLQEPQLIVLDNPFVGLDPETRKILHDLINTLQQVGKIVFLITTEEEIPSTITHVLSLENGAVREICERKNFKAQIRAEIPVSLDLELLKKLTPPSEEKFSVVVEMKDVTVQYGDKLILDKINWKVKRGERWALRGHNGSGKSTLLSLILADNPKAYSNELYLFDRKRGSGESIWDIKAKIGQISPELHIFFQRNTNYTEALSMAGGGSDNSFSSSSSVTCFEVVCSGFYEQVGSSYELASLQYRYAEEWMELLKISSFKKQPLGSLSLGQQRLVLLARALVKNPPLLILDEPCQGLDAAQTKHFVNIVDELCKYSDKTLIYVSHYVEDIPSCVDHMLVLEDGRVKE